MSGICLPAGTQPAESADRSAVNGRQEMPAWVDDWPKFAAFAQAHIASNYKRDLRYMEPAMALALPGVNGQQVTWTGVFQHLVMQPPGDPLEARTLAVVKLYPAMRAQIDGCVVVADGVTLHIASEDLAAWVKLRSGVAVRFTGALGIPLLDKPDSPVAAGFMSHDRGRCSFGPIVAKPRLLESW